jgi:hypothetical protein
MGQILELTHGAWRLLEGVRGLYELGRHDRECQWYRFEPFVMDVPCRECAERSKQTQELWYSTSGCLQPLVLEKVVVELNRKTLLSNAEGLCLVS